MRAGAVRSVGVALGALALAWSPLLGVVGEGDEALDRSDHTIAGIHYAALPEMDGTEEDYLRRVAPAPRKLPDLVHMDVQTYAMKPCERRSAMGDEVHAHYTGTLYDTGEKFDSSRDRGQPFTFRLGIGQVIKGWDHGMQGMCPGDKRVLTIGPNYAYGKRGAGGIIPPDATLVFDVEMISFEPHGIDPRTHGGEL